jgi:hypothetical protein
MPQTGFVKAMKGYFGLLPGQSVVQFGSELRALSYEEKLDFATGLRSIGGSNARTLKWRRSLRSCGILAFVLLFAILFNEKNLEGRLRNRYARWAGHKSSQLPRNGHEECTRFVP